MFRASNVKVYHVCCTHCGRAQKCPVNSGAWHCEACGLHFNIEVKEEKKEEIDANDNKKS